MKNSLIKGFINGLVFMICNVAALSALSMLFDGSITFEEIISVIFVMGLAVVIIGIQLGGGKYE